MESLSEFSPRQTVQIKTTRHAHYIEMDFGRNVYQCEVDDLIWLKFKDHIDPI
jgi:hypothetical protein